MCGPTEESGRVVLETTVGAGATSELKLCMLGCEDKAPYGPTDHTAKMFLDLLQQGAKLEQLDIKIVITVYRVQVDDYPASYQSFDGVLLPGSFSAAYDGAEWIEKLKHVIRDELWKNKIPTLGVCFGHQVLAHALHGGKAIKCPAGPQAGCRFMDTYNDTFLVNSDSKLLPLLYTHGDMVETLPVMATRLGSTEAVPNQAAMYHYSETTPSDGDTASAIKKPVFVSFQAHPEYASEGSEQPTLKNILCAMEDSKDITIDQHTKALQYVEENWDAVYQHSLQSIVTTCRLLNWFPKVKDEQ